MAIIHLFSGGQNEATESTIETQRFKRTMPALVRIQQQPERRERGRRSRQNNRSGFNSNTMTLNDYQQAANATAIYGENLCSPMLRLAYTTLGLNGEAGEVAEHIKKALRDDDGVLTDERRAKITKELGDVLWYLAQTATEIGVPLAEIAAENVRKLTSRKERGVLNGAGSDR